MAEFEYNWIRCPRCNRPHAFEATIQGDVPVYEQVSCPECGEDLGMIRADLGYRYIGELADQFSCSAYLDAEFP